MARLSVEIEGMERLMRLAKGAVSPAQQQALAQAVMGTAEQVLTQSKQLVPVDTTALKNSGRVENLKVSPDEVSVEITYGGPSAKYAWVVHEDMTMNHSPSLLTAVTKRPRRGQAKYLEIPVMAYRDKFVKAVIGRYSKYFRGA